MTQYIVRKYNTATQQWDAVADAMPKTDCIALLEKDGDVQVQRAARNNPNITAWTAKGAYMLEAQMGVDADRIAIAKGLLPGEGTRAGVQKDVTIYYLPEMGKLYAICAKYYEAGDTDVPGYVPVNAVGPAFVQTFKARHKAFDIALHQR